MGRLVDGRYEVVSRIARGGMATVYLAIDRRLDRDVAQCGYCQPGQIMAAVALVWKVRREGRSITDGDLDAIRNICRCGTYTRIREAIAEGERRM